MRAVLIWIASFFWSGLSALARGAALRGIVRSTRLGAAVRVISVGNIQAGGAGKTPIAARIAREAAATGKSVCILSRGYRSSWEKTGGLIVPGAGPADASQSGDEAALLHELAPGAFVAVGADRVRQYQEAVRTLGREFDIVILDDGFQHWKIKKDLEIVAVTPRRRTEFLFRDWASALQNADLIVFTKGAGKAQTSNVARVRASYKLGAPIKGAEKCLLVTSVADPLAVHRSVTQAGYEVMRHIPFPDHARYTREEIETIMNKAARTGLSVVITGKDWVKWRSLGIEKGRVQVIEPELVFEEGSEVWSKILWER
jgi:tetraacyldisaccharide 4'-kinase